MENINEKTINFNEEKTIRFVDEQNDQLEMIENKPNVYDLSALAKAGLIINILVGITIIFSVIITAFIVVQTEDGLAILIGELVLVLLAIISLIISFKALFKRTKGLVKASAIIGLFFLAVVGVVFIIVGRID